MDRHKKKELTRFLLRVGTGVVVIAGRSDPPEDRLTVTTPVGTLIRRRWSLLPQVVKLDQIRLPPKNRKQQQQLIHAVSNLLITTLMTKR